MRFFYILLLLFFFNFSEAQRGGRGPSGERPEITLKGQVIDGDSNTGLEFATISIYSKRDSSVLGGGLSGSEGIFEVTSKMGPMFIEVEFIGYDKYVLDPVPFDREALRSGERTMDLGIIKIGSAAESLEEVTIRAEKSTNQFTLDKRVFNVGQDLANRGGTAEDLLDNVPSVTVDIDGTVNLRGSTGVRILINGQPSRMAASENGLKSIPADMIERVEVITNPSSRYEAEGVAGIINIVLRKEKRSGFNGSFNSSVSYPIGASIGANLNYRKGDINWFAGYNLNRRTGPGNGRQEQEIQLINNLFLSDQTRTMDRRSLSHNLQGGLEYFITDKSSLTGSIRYRISDDNNRTDLLYEDFLNDRSNILRITDRVDLETEDESGLTYNIDYNHEFSSRDHKLSFNIQYEDDLEVESSAFEEVTRNTSRFLQQRSQNDEGQRNWIAQADYVQPLGSKDHKIEFGLRTSIRRISNNFVVDSINNEGEWVSLENFTNDFQYDEDIHAAYIQYGNKYGKFSYQAGLRAEYAIINTILINDNIENRRDSLNFFPSLFLNYEFNSANAMQLSYSRRIRRPRFWDLNPFFSFSDPRNFFSGNPLLNPEYTDSYELNYLRYWEKATLSGGIFYRYTEDVISRIRRIVDSQFFITQPENLGIQNDFGVEINGSLTAIEWLRLNGNINFFRSITTSGTPDINLDADTYALTSRIMARASFWDSDLQSSINYRSPRLRPQGLTRSITSVDLAWSKDFLPKKNLTITLSVRDLFNSRKRRYETFGENFTTVGEFQWRVRTFTLAANYRLNQKKQRGGSREGGRGDFEGGEF